MTVALNRHLDGLDASILAAWAGEALTEPDGIALWIFAADGGRWDEVNIDEPRFVHDAETLKKAIAALVARYPEGMEEVVDNCHVYGEPMGFEERVGFFLERTPDMLYGLLPSRIEVPKWGEVTVLGGDGVDLYEITAEGRMVIAAWSRVVYSA
ncbi:MAG: hypothetical protein COX57_13400 [Alphaproteobacteria bacterium CG_4_10_14_0_2_um_filter_63_37]|nr:MAG: hypothetical protein AUJ55_12705 [Proteobacteria bacterium CG1_02_64_396]PJA23479.1 MAG: hypothetical protein COX57_13400 [Alphaproteobacteria bacterium CG_4_10_14_0_2_um_filter_63_37]